VVAERPGQKPCCFSANIALTDSYILCKTRDLKSFNTWLNFLHQKCHLTKELANLLNRNRRGKQSKDRIGYRKTLDNPSKSTNLLFFSLANPFSTCDKSKKQLIGRLLNKWKPLKEYNLH